MVCLLEDSRLKDTGSCEGLFEDSPSHERLIAMHVKVFMRGTQQYLSLILYNVNRYLAQLLKTFHKVFLRLKLSSHLI